MSSSDAMDDEGYKIVFFRCLRAVFVKIVKKVFWDELKLDNRNRIEIIEQYTRNEHNDLQPPKEPM